MQFYNPYFWLAAYFFFLFFPMNGIKAQAPDLSAQTKLSNKEDEIESLCQILPSEKRSAQDALNHAKLFFSTDQPLYFKQLTGGAYNPPILVSQWNGLRYIPLGVLKLEQSAPQAEMRMQALSEMRQNGCKIIPQAIQSQTGEYLVNLNGKLYSCIEYLEITERSPVTLEEILKLAGQFHASSKKACLPQAHYRKTLDWFSEASASISHLDARLMQKDPSIFTTTAWENCVRSTRYLTSPSFHKIYEGLPTQLIHGDITPQNILFSFDHPFFIDFETMRVDIRLRDFATFLGGAFLDDFLLLIKENRLMACIESNYGKLEDLEKKYLPWIVLLERCGVLAWSLQELADAFSKENWQKVQTFRNLTFNTIHEVNRLCAIPLIESQLNEFQHDQF